MRRAKLLSVVVPTRNRAPLLRQTLASLAAQTAPRETFEVVVVDDGSTDETPTVCEAFSETLDLVYARIEPSGTAVAKNEAIALATGETVAFFDDDNIAARALVAGHLGAHRRHPEPHVALLSFATWSPALKISAAMEYATEVGLHVLAYPALRDGQRLDFRYFWAGCASCKRRFLLDHGLFDPAFAQRLEDVELGYRLWRAGLSIVYERSLVVYVNRPLSYDDICTRSEGVGRALPLLAAAHPAPEIERYCRLANPFERRGGPLADAPRLWSAAAHDLPQRVARARELGPRLERRGAAERVRTSSPHVARASWQLSPRRRELGRLYGSTWADFRVKGAAEALESAARL